MSLQPNQSFFERSKACAPEGRPHVAHKLNTSGLLKPMRRTLGRSAGSALPQDKLTTESLKKARSELAKLDDGGYEIASFEQCSERAKWFHVFRLRTFIVLALQRPEFEDEKMYLRFHWRRLGLFCLGPSAEDTELACTKGTFYPHLRRKMLVAEPSSALRRLDDVLACLETNGVLHSPADFNSGHFVTAAVSALLASPRSTSGSSISYSVRPGETPSRRRTSFSSALLNATLPEIEHLEPVDSNGEVIAMAAGRNVVVYPPSAARLGTGAFGQVWRARDRRTLEEFAVKSLSDQVAERERQIFQHLRGYTHPCVVQVFNFEHVADVSLCVATMQLCTGGDLLGPIKGSRREAERTGTSYVVPSASLMWSGQIFLGLEHLHLQARMLYLDLKPQNVLLNARGHAQLADFGASRLGTCLSRTWTGGDVCPGTAGYTAPEVLRQEPYDNRADLYSYGALFWVLWTGGTASNAHPQPPSGTMQSCNDWPALFDDWRLLQAQVEVDDPPLANEVRHLVANLCTRQASQRLAHEDVREHAVMQPLALPEFESCPEEVLGWLEEPPDRN